ncbi:17117_t:CDS:2 [Funneliformis geosporum]|uniref:11178_t:CDS:1 n=1 Tax=Funneliformis geosporum TaxID=1117311 RepID=A0A9W4SGK3_9GLOM|nr:17117_t:CDS:2 [Funneliformis geosporum]CAI2167750.1 11178_t:CDS:2 [Funneliformis geosporum]
MIASTLPSEILIEIFSYLHPKELYSLLSVCKRYRIILWSKSSTTTQRIWRSSRIRYLLHTTIEPPENMCEQQYNYLLIMVNVCQFCGEYRKLSLTMHWEFRLYCCKECLSQRCISRNTLVEKLKVSGELLTCLQPILTPPKKQKIFLISDVRATLNEYFKIEDEQQRLDWIQKSQLKVINMTRLHKEYKTQFDLIRYSVKERIQRLKDGFKFYQVTSTQN